MRAFDVLVNAIRQDACNLEMSPFKKYEYFQAICEKVKDDSKYDVAVMNTKEWPYQIRKIIKESPYKRILKAVESNAVYVLYIANVSSYVLSQYGTPNRETEEEARSRARKWLGSRSGSIFSNDFRIDFDEALREDFPADIINISAFWEEFDWSLREACSSECEYFVSRVLALLISGALLGPRQHLDALGCSRISQFEITHKKPNLRCPVDDDAPRGPLNLKIYKIDFIDQREYSWRLREGEKYQIDSSESIIVGRTPDRKDSKKIPIPVAINDTTFSRKHMVIRWQDNNWLIENCSESGTTKLIRNGKLIAELGKNDVHQLANGDLLFIRIDVVGFRIEFARSET